MEMQMPTGRSLGAAMLMTAIASLLSGAFLLGPLLDNANYAASMIQIESNLTQFKWGIFSDLITAAGIIWLGACFLVLLKEQHPILATTAFSLYLFEAVMLGMSKLFLAGIPVILATPTISPVTSALLFELSDFAYDIHMLAFTMGGLLFYSLFLVTRRIPLGFAVWGVISILPLLVGSVLQIFRLPVSILFYVPYIPFEFVLGIWILIYGIKDTELA